MLVEWCLAAAVGISAQLASSEISTVLNDERGWNRAGITFQQTECDGHVIEIEVVPVRRLRDLANELIELNLIEGAEKVKEGTRLVYGITFPFAIPQRVLLPTEIAHLHFTHTTGFEYFADLWTKTVEHEVGWHAAQRTRLHTEDGVAGFETPWPTDEEIELAGNKFADGI